MRMKSLALATTLTLLSTSALVSSDAHAQKGVTLQPQSGWAVKRINDGSPDAYCALARRFKQNMIMTLARNDNNESSLALDFADAGFDTARTYPITLDPGAGAQRSYNIKPSSARAFVVRVGNDQKFLSSMNKTGYLRVELDGESYHFNLADIDEGQSQLDACLATAITPAAGDEGQGSYNASPASASQNNNAALEALRNEKVTLEKRLSALESENEKLRVESARIANNPAELPTVAPADNTELLALQEQIRSLKTENDSLKKLAETVSQNKDSQNPAEIAAKDVSVVELARENARLQTLLKEQKNTPDLQKQLQDLTIKISSLEEENLELSNKALAAQDQSDMHKDFERQILALQSENDALRLSLESEAAAQEDFATLRQDVENLEKTNQDLNARIASMAREKEQALANLSSYKAQKQDSESNLDSKQDNENLLQQMRQEIQVIENANIALLNEKEMQLRDLQMEMETLKLSSQSDAVEISNSTNEYEARIEVLETQNESLKQELASIADDQDLLQQMSAQIEALNSEKATLKTALDEASGKMAAMETAFQERAQTSDELVRIKEEVARLDKDILLHQSQNADLKAELETLKLSSSDAETTTQALKDSLDKLQGENSALKEQIANLSDEGVAENVELEKVLAENESLRTQIAGLSDEPQKDLLVLQEEMLELQATNTALKSEFTEKMLELKTQSEALLKDAQQKVAALKAENETLKISYEEQLASLQEKLGAARESSVQDTASIEEQLEAVKKEYDKNIAALEQANSSLKADTKIQISSIEERNAALILEYQDKIQSLEEAASVTSTEDLEKLTALQSDYERLQAENESLNSQLEQAQQSVLDSDLKIGLLENELTEKVDEKSSELDLLQERLALLETENKDLKLAYVNSDGFNQEMQKEWNDTSALIAQLKNENESYKEQLAEAELALEVAVEGQSEKIEELQALNETLSTELEERVRNYEVLANNMDAMKRDYDSSAAQNVSIGSDELEALRVQNIILNQEIDRLRKEAGSRDGRPLMQEASLNVPSTSTQEDDGEMEMAEMAAQVAEIQPAAGEPNNDVGSSAQPLEDEQDVDSIVQKVINEVAAPSPQQAAENEARAAEAAATQNNDPVAADIPAEQPEGEQAISDEYYTGEAPEEGLSEAQMHEQALKRQISEGAPIAPVMEDTEENIAGPVDQAVIETEEISAPDEMPRTVDTQNADMAQPELTEGEIYAPAVDVAKILGEAQVPVPDGISVVDKFTGQDRVAYQWRTSQNIFGSAHQKPISNMNQFDEYVREYLTMTEQRCSGDFAIIPAGSDQHGQTRIDSYEIACIGAGVDSSASVAFFNMDGTFTILAHEAPTENMAVAMETRDKIIKNVGRS